ncbi:MAG: Gfo/Idh/MocA family protein [Bradymonadia bacterium]
MRIVVVGVGRWGRIHCDKVVKADWSTLAAVVDPDESRARKVGQDFDAPYWTSWSGEIKADLMILATPWQRVAQLVKEACGQGLPFLAEKPVTVVLDEWRHLATAREKAGVFGAVGYQMRFHPRLHELNGARTLTVVREESGFDDLWRLVCDCGVHDLDLALFLGGAVDSVEAVQLTDRCLEVQAVSANGCKVTWIWRLGDKLTRTITGDSTSIDLVAPSGDLMASQWQAVGKALSGHTSSVATLDDVGEVTKVLQAIKARVQIA